jgi:hypothetical protein
MIPVPKQKCFDFCFGAGKHVRMPYRNAKHFARQGATALAPQPPLQNCKDAVLK